MDKLKWFTRLIVPRGYPPLAHYSDFAGSKDGKPSKKYPVPACNNGHLLGPMVRALSPGLWVCPICHSVYEDKQP